MSVASRSLDAVTADATGEIVDFGVVVDKLALQVDLGGTVVATGGTIKVYGSLDGLLWSAALLTWTIGTDTDEDIKFVTGKPVRFARAVLASLTGGTAPTVTALVGGC